MSRDCDLVPPGCSSGWEIDTRTAVSSTAHFTGLCLALLLSTPVSPKCNFTVTRGFCVCSFFICVKKQKKKLSSLLSESFSWRCQKGKLSLCHRPVSVEPLGGAKGRFLHLILPSNIERVLDA